METPKTPPVLTPEQAAMIEGTGAAPVSPEEQLKLDMIEWYTAAEQMEVLKKREAILRVKLFKAFFPTPVEGTNSYELPDGFMMKGIHVINRSVDQAVLTTLATEFAKQQINIAELIKWKPELVKSIYNTLSAEQKQLFDQALVIKEGTPQLDIVMPKRKGAHK